MRQDRSAVQVRERRSALALLMVDGAHSLGDLTVPPANRITEIVNGTRGITGETTALLSYAFGTTPEFWLNLRSRYELDLANARVPREAIQRADEFNRELRAA